ncbi:beta-glucuronidase [uncultured Microbacterium sp.]|uniref:Beta-glucuronidase n=1 Tax=uncultured Microbacterium sp. TaxID=191216 RepID=A0A1Y5NUE0_9MICO|nr:beta-glucuronidase [uncultured Microbacterium sp.]SBS70017.1 beta-D-glucuronidase [uncultured Microbacterium sp.]
MLKPQTSATRELVNLDGMWRFALDTAEVPEPWSAPLTTTLEAPVPSSYNDLFVDPAIRDHVGWVWYQRDVRVPRGWTGERVIVRVDSATHEGAVYVDGTEVARHVGGYLPFEADVTDLVTPGETFHLTIGVNNVLTNETQPPGRVEELSDGRRVQRYYHDFYNYAGLARSVWLASRPAVHVADITVTTGVDESTGVVSYLVETAGDADVTVSLRDADGLVVAQQAGADGELRVADVTLWQPGAGYLYDLDVEAHVDGVLVDAYRLPVGVRTVEVRGLEFLINGEPFYFTGFGKHEDTPVRGKGHDPSYLVHDMELMGWIGANSFRTSHYPYAEEVLEYADRHGIVVIDETAAVGLNFGLIGGLTGQKAPATFAPDGVNDAARERHAEHIRELVARDKNHPSVVMWSIANEPASQEEGAREYFAPLVDVTRAADPTRPVTYVNVMMAPPPVERIADLFDVICVNRYYGWYVNTGDLASAEAALESELLQWQDIYARPLIMTEYGGDTMPGIHSVWDQPWSEEYQSALLDMFHRVHDRVPAIVGEQVWNFADFQTSVGIFRVDGNKKGVFTRDRRPKAAAHSLRARWSARNQNGQID